MVKIIIGLTIILVAGCAKSQQDYLAEEGSAIFSAHSDLDSVEADGKSTVSIFAIVKPDADLKVVSFSTNVGNFLDSNNTFSTEAAFNDSSLVAKAVLVAGLEISNEVQVKVSVPKIVRNVPLRFIKAFPDSVKIQSPLASLTREFGSTLPLSVYLLRTKGIPSLHQTIQLNALKPDSSIIAMDIDAMDPGGSDQKGLIKANLVLKDTTYLGPVKIIATAQGKNTTLSNAITIFITEKK